MKFDPAILFLLLLLIDLSSPFSFSQPDTISAGSSLSVENPDHNLTSSNGVFSAGFYPLGGDNAFYFAIWFKKPSTILWIANRDIPVNSRKSKLSLLKTGNLILKDADGLIVWSTGTSSFTFVRLKLHDTGNLVLQESNNGNILWQSFNFPTDTLLPLQSFTKNTQLVSSRSQTNFSTGFYNLLFDYENLLRLLYNGPDVSSVYWFNPGLVSWEAGRTTYKSNREAFLGKLGNFTSSDSLKFKAADYGAIIPRRLTLDFDGNLRLYSLNEAENEWVVSWIAISNPCRIHGSCGENGVCRHDNGLGRNCSCLPGFAMKNESDWSYGCQPKFTIPESDVESDFLKMNNHEFYGYDSGFFRNYSLEMCKSACFSLQNICKGIQHTYDKQYHIWNCYTKARLLNGRHSIDFIGHTYVKFPKESLLRLSFNNISVNLLNCSGVGNVTINRTYEKGKESTTLRYLLYLVFAFGGVEASVITSVWLFLRDDTPPPGSGLDTTGFRRYTYRELKKATKNFSQEIGRGAGGIVYKGVLQDNRVTAVKQLYESSHDETSDLIAEISTIGNLNHMNLIEMWGYCAERKQKLLVYEYLEHGSLVANLISNSLDCEKRFVIALGTARGLAYLHEECLDWILHCDVKPQNIILDSSYQPKVADFGLSKLLNRSDMDKNKLFSRMRGTRGYMAPEWVFNLPITSKVDVYSYGMVVLELVTGKSPAIDVQANCGGEMEQRRLVTWVREKMSEDMTMESKIEKIIDPSLQGRYDASQMAILVSVALQCVDEDRNERPTMSQVVEMLYRHKR